MKAEMNEMMETMVYAHETEQEIMRRHRKGDIAAKKHLAAIYPISTESVRKTRNGAYIHKGNTIRYQYEQTISRKHRREEAKREIREYIPESYVDNTPGYREALERELAALRLEKSCLNRDREALINDDYPDYYLIGEVDDEIYAVCGRISEIAEVLDNEVGTWSF